MIRVLIHYSSFLISFLQSHLIKIEIYCSMLHVSSHVCSSVLFLTPQCRIYIICIYTYSNTKERRCFSQLRFDSWISLFFPFLRTYDRSRWRTQRTHAIAIAFRIYIYRHARACTTRVRSVLPVGFTNFAIYSRGTSRGHPSGRERLVFSGSSLGRVVCKDEPEEIGGYI